MAHLFILERYSGKNSRYTCPSCKQQHQFTRYIDKLTNNHLADHVGICNRATKCSYHYPPKQYFNDNPQRDTNSQNKPLNHPVRRSEAKEETLGRRNFSEGERNPKHVTRNPKPSCPLERKRRREPISFINPQLFQKTINNHNQNNLITYLDTIFENDIVDHLINIYKIGTASYYNGGTTIFWQIDMQGRVRTGKLIKYDPVTGKRIKKPFVATNWFHSITYGKEFNLCQCLFGEHLLAEYDNMPIAVVESEKTAIIAQAKMPDFLWMATGSLNEFKPDKLKVLKGRRVVAFPDLGAYDYWIKKAAMINFPIEVSNYLENNATAEQRNEGMDIADFL